MCDSYKCDIAISNFGSAGHSSNSSDSNNCNTILPEIADTSHCSNSSDSYKCSTGSYDIAGTSSCSSNSRYLIATLTPSPGAFDCDFEADFCGWTQDRSDNFNWTRQAGASESSGTGPSFDHTMGNETGTGYYIFIEASAPQDVGDIARLYSPAVTAASAMCLRFWYHMYGMHMGELHVYTRTDPAPEVLVFNRTGRQGDEWHQAEVEIDIAGTYQVGTPALKTQRFAVWARSYAYNDPGYNVNGTYITINGEESRIEERELVIISVPRRGHQVFIVNERTGAVENKTHFDTQGDGVSAAQQLTTFLQGVPEGRVIVIAVQQSGDTTVINEPALTPYGANITQLGRRESWAMITQKGSIPPWFVEKHSANGTGPTVVEAYIPTGNEWSQVFSTVRGTGQRVYDAWSAGPGETVLHNKCQVVEKWASLNIKRVKIVLESSSGDVELIFDGQNTDKFNWFSKSRLLSSPWNDISTESQNVFSMEGATGPQRSFYINRHYQNCRDTGWLAVTEGGPAGVCSWEQVSEDQLPYIMFSRLNTYVSWNDAVNTGIANRMVIYIDAGDVVCSCPAGYTLNENGTSCDVVPLSLTFRTHDNTYSGSGNYLTVEIFSDVCDDICTATTVSGLKRRGREYVRTFVASDFGDPTRLRLTTSGTDRLRLDWIDVYNGYTGRQVRFSCPSDGCTLSRNSREGSTQIVLGLNVTTTSSPSTTMASTECPAEWSVFNGKCYKVFTETLTYSQAKQNCNDHGGRLAMIKDSAINNFLKTLPSDHKWFGLSDQVTEGQFLWEDGTSLASTGFTDWYPGEPNGGAGENCVQYWRHSWNDRGCTDLLGFTCEVQATRPTPTPTHGTATTPTPAPTPVTACPDGYIQYSAFCFKAIDELKTFEGARQLCAMDSARLAMPKNSGTNVFLESLTTADSYWIGLNDMDVEGQWRWEDGTTLDMTNDFSSWAAGEPNSNGEQHCVRHYDEGLWDDNQCHDTLKVLCQINLACPTGYSLHGSFCYKAFDELKTNNGARQVCSEDSGRLAIIKDNITNTFLARLISQDNYYIGLNDLNVEGQFRWEDGTVYNNDTDFSNWSPGEPDNSGNQDCVKLSGDGLWGDKDCTIKRKFICQINLAPKKWREDSRCGEGYPAPNGNPAECNPSGVRPCCSPHNWCGLNADHCDCEGCVDYRSPGHLSDWVKHGSRYYKFLQSTFVPYTEARALCEAEDAKIAMPKDQAAHDFIVQYRNQFYNNINLWIGLNDINVEGDFVWEDGTPLGSLSRWFPRQPNNGNGLQHCAVLTPETNPYPNQWRDDDCSYTRAAICERGCPTNYTQLNDSCFKAFEDPKTFSESREACAALGGVLAMPKDRVTNNLLTNLMQPGINYWFGLTYHDTEGQWRWEDGSVYDIDTDFGNWSLNEPNNMGGQEHCAHFTKRHSWNDRRCHRAHSYICQIQPGCPTDYTQLNDSCFKAFEDLKTFSNSREACAALGGVLAMSKDRVTNDFLASLMQPGLDYWLGLMYHDAEGQWRWEDGSVYDLDTDFRNWNPGEPNNMGGLEHCAYLTTKYTWNDYRCHNNFNYICQIQTATRPTPTPTSVTAELPEDRVYNVTTSSSTFRWELEAIPVISFAVEAKASSDVRLALSPVNNFTSVMYEIIIGGWSNLLTTLRRTDSEDHLAVKLTPGILPAGRFRRFWVQIIKGTVRVGMDNQTSPLIEWTDPSPIDVRFVGFATSEGNLGQFRFYSTLSGKQDTHCLAIRMACFLSNH
ncbi:uncharacterized protein LOC118417473 [Branchiostoma floridae]|uniref:Uncharacterized protein LOC118417473 n=1 Tax=Branchiostoma floridae TaxID=7739 RepID=A0A9J7MS63_BRAFL|nr:uncharacterized protein LOC118417473 [Branchiostoma floridae]